MSEMSELVQNHDYLTPEIAEKSGVSKLMFYQYVHENKFESIGHSIYATGNELTDTICSAPALS